MRFVDGLDLGPLHDGLGQSKRLRLVTLYSVVVAPPLNNNPDIDTENTEAAAKKIRPAAQGGLKNIVVTLQEASGGFGMSVTNPLSPESPIRLRRHGE